MALATSGVAVGNRQQSSGGGASSRFRFLGRSGSAARGQSQPRGRGNSRGAIGPGEPYVKSDSLAPLGGGAGRGRTREKGTWWHFLVRCNPSGPSWC